MTIHEIESNAIWAAMGSADPRMRRLADMIVELSRHVETLSARLKGVERDLDADPNLNINKEPAT